MLFVEKFVIRELRLNLKDLFDVQFDKVVELLIIAAKKHSHRWHVPFVSLHVFEEFVEHPIL